MADAYNAPELREWYCATECPLGKECREIEDMPSERALIRLQNSAKELTQVLDKLGYVMQDGRIDDGEEHIVQEVKAVLLEMKRRIT